MSSPRTQGSSPEQWAIYVRVSTRHQAEKGFSLQDQRERLTVFAEEKGWTYQIFEDAGESGEQLDQRPAIEILPFNLICWSGFGHVLGLF